MNERIVLYEYIYSKNLIRLFHMHWQFAELHRWKIKIDVMLICDLNECFFWKGYGFKTIKLYGSVN